MRLGLDSVQVRRGSRPGRAAALAVTALAVTARSIAGAAPTEVSVEQIQKWNPDVIVAGLPADAKAMMADPRLKGVKAVINHQVLTNPAGTIIWMYYGTEEALNIQWAAKELHPDLDLPAVTKAFYQQFFGYQLSGDQVSSILHPPS